ncbi:MAG: hypothetical protein HKN78_05380 [Sphingomonadaceae bacterium]|nr:hypothetical protein [Sphingomonadaceae bacterium]
MFARLFLSSSLFALAACGVSESNPPSLAYRNVEGIMNRPMRAIAPVASASDPALASRIAELVAQAEGGQGDFAAALPRTRSAVSAAGGAESESWIAAQLALSVLDSSRSETVAALVELDAIFAAQTSAGEPAETERLLTARERVIALYQGQAESYEALLAGLRSR